MSKTKYIHYGSNKFDRKLFKTIKNQGWGTKPSGGLWASDVSALYGWKQWCQDEQFRVGKLRKNYIFYLSDNAKVFHIRSVNDLKELPKIKDNQYSIWYPIDFEKAAQIWDAIELHLSEDKSDRWEEGLYFQLYGWDCDSILIMNPDIIEV